MGKAVFVFGGETRFSGATGGRSSEGIMLRLPALPDLEGSAADGAAAGTAADTAAGCTTAAATGFTGSMPVFVYLSVVTWIGV